MTPLAGRRSTPLDAVLDRLGPIASRDVPLGPLTTYRVGGRAGGLVELSSERELDLVREALPGSGVDLLVLGMGSNLLIADTGFPGLTVRLGGAFANVDIAVGTSAVVVGGAVALPVLARQTPRSGLAGLEWAVGVPGSVGGAVRMNAGGHGSETSESLVRARIVELAGRQDTWLRARELELGYRRSAIRPDQIVVAAELQLERGDADESSLRIAEIVRWRRENQPGGQNAGSIFMNPPSGSAGRIVEEAGLKGHRLGTAVVSTKHANFIQADPGGSADDVRKLIYEVQALVERRLGVTLSTEVQMIGFEP